MPETVEAVEAVELSGEALRVLRESLEGDFAAFALATMNPEYFDENLHGKICDQLQHCGGEFLGVLPRSFLKTTIVTRYLVWRGLKNPELRMLYVSNTMTNASKTIMEIMGLFEKNQLIQALWPERIPDFGKRWSTDSATLRRESAWPEGTFEAAGVGTNIVKRHYDIIVEDDTVAPTIDSMSGEEVMPSKDDIEKAVGFHKMVPPLFIDINSSTHIVIGTRWPGEDLIGFILANESSYKVFNIPALEEGWTFESKVVDGVEVQTIVGKPTYKRYDCKTLNKIFKLVGTYMFYALYLNSPLPSENRRFQQKWIRYWEELPFEGRRTITVDPADPPTGKKYQDYSAIVSAVFNNVGLFIVRSLRARMTGRELVQKTLDLAKEDNVDCIRVEVNRHPHLEQEFNDEMLRRGQYHYIEYVKTSRAKEARIMALQPLYESGRVFHNRVAKNLEFELLAFPNGKHDDEIDALAWQLENYVNVPEVVFAKKKNDLSNYKFTVSADEIFEELEAEDFSPKWRIHSHAS